MANSPSGSFRFVASCEVLFTELTQIIDSHCSSTKEDKQLCLPGHYVILIMSFYYFLLPRSGSRTDGRSGGARKSQRAFD